jgi:hypothetical protein
MLNKTEVLETVSESELTVETWQVLGRRVNRLELVLWRSRLLCSASVPFEKAEVFVAGLKSTKCISWKLEVAGL